VSVAAKIPILAVLAFLGGVGTVYAPVPTFTAVAATFALALWWFIRDQGRFRPKVSRGAKLESKPRSTAATKLVSGYLLVWWLALIAPLATYTPRGSTSAEVSAAAAQGSLRNQALVISFGLVGSFFLPTAIKRFDPAFRWVAALWALYLCWAFASLSWSIYPPLTLRNAGALALVTVGTFGLGAGFYSSLPNGRNLLLRHIFMAGVLGALVLLVPLPLHWEQYNLLDPSQRVTIGEGMSVTTYVTRPAVCALLVLVATQILRLRRWQSRDWLWVAILVLALLAVKARGPVLWGILALVIFYLSYKTQTRDRVLQAGLLLVIGIGTYIYYSAGVFNWLVPYLTRGDVQSTENLTGRIPLWDVLLPQLGQRPWLGAGFAAFWSPENVYQIEGLVGFPAVSAHNGFLEELLNTGIVGLAIFLTFYFYAMVVVMRRAHQGDPLGWLIFLFMVFYLLLNLSNALMQKYFEVPFIVILAMLGLMSSKPITDSLTRRGAPPSSARGRVISPR
jgi:O-antigen ligase